MIVYLMTFFTSFIFSFLAHKSIRNDKKKSFVFLSLMAILIPSLLAAFRIAGIGTDTLRYIQYTFNNALKYQNFFVLLKVSEVEPLYVFLNYVIVKFTDNIHVLYFFLQIIIMAFSYFATYNKKEKKVNYYAYLFFQLLYYNRSLNMCRQTISIVIFLYAYRFIKERKLIPYLLFILLAIGFHQTAIVCIPIYFIVPLLEGKNHKSIKIIIVISCIFLFVFYRQIMLLLINGLNILDEKYLFYVQGTSSNLLMIEVFFKIILLALMVVFYNILCKKDDENHIYIFFMILDIIFYFFGLYANYAYRLSYYLGYFNIFLLPQISSVFATSKQKGAIKVVVILLVIAYAFIYYDYFGYDQTIPYVSIFS